MSLPYYDLYIPLLACTILVAVLALIGTIVAFVRIKSRRESAKMQEGLQAL